MSKIALLAINAKYVHSSLSVWVIAAGVKAYAQTPHEINIVEATIHQENNEIAERVAANAPDVVGISVYIWNAAKLPEILQRLRELLPGAKLVLGGPEAAYNANYWLENGADCVLQGEGEYTFPALLDEPAQSRKRELRPHACGEQTPLDPYCPEYFEKLNSRLAYIETSRGCPFTCAFCLSACSAVRYFPMETVKTQLRKLAKSDARTIKLVDRTFNASASRAYELFEYIIGLDTECRFHFEVAADLFDERTIALLQSAPSGRIQLEAGLQSFFAPALEAAARKTDLNKAERNIRALLNGGNIHIHVDLIAGLPYETLDDFKNSFDRAYALGAHTLQLGFLKLLHGSELRKQARVLGIEYLPTPPYEIQSSPWLSADDILTLKQAENALQHTNNKARFLSALEYVLTVSGSRAFELFYAIGGAARNHGTDLSDYAGQILDFCKTLPQVNEQALKDRMVYDWLSMVKGKNMPESLRNKDNRRSQVIIAAEKHLGRKLRRDEAAILYSGEGIYADSEDQDPVTGLYRVCTIKSSATP